MSRFPQLIVLTALAMLAGCNQTPTPATPAADATATATPPATGGVGTIDVEAISQRYGFPQRLQARLQELEAALGEITRMKQTQVLALQKSFGDKPTDEQLKQLRAADEKAGGEIQRAKADANRQFNEVRSYMQNVLESSLKEPVDKVMKRRGLTVLLLQQSVYRRTTAADVTQEVLELLEKTPDAIKWQTMSAPQPTAATPAKSDGMPDLPGGPDKTTGSGR